MNLLSRVISWRWLSRPTPPQSALIDSLRSKFSQTKLHKTGASEAEQVWGTRQIALRDMVLTRDPRRLLRWNIWKAFCGQGGSGHLHALQSRPDWNTHWKPALREPRFGQPLRCLHWPCASNFRIWQTFVLSELHKLSGKRVADFSVILEFGGGYGALCELAFSLGFRGTYIIFDLPEFCYLQTYYLKSLGLPVRESINAERNPFCASPRAIPVSEVEELELWLEQLPSPSLFVSVLGLTDTSMNFRARFLPLLAHFEMLYFLYQPHFREVDNIQWLDHLKASLESFTWLEEQPPVLGQNRLLLGRRHLAAPQAGVVRADVSAPGNCDTGDGGRARANTRVGDEKTQPYIYRDINRLTKHDYAHCVFDKLLFRRHGLH